MIKHQCWLKISFFQYGLSKHASDESHLQFVDLVSVKAAIRLNDYFEDSYIRIRSFVADNTCEEPPKILLSLLPNTFDTKTAIAAGKELQNISERTVMNYLRELCHSRLLKKSKAGHYEKLVYESSKYSMNEKESSTQNYNEWPRVAACSFFSLAVLGLWKRCFLAKLQGLQTANGASICSNYTDRNMSEYRFHLQRYKTGCKVTCPKCGMKSCFTRYVDEKAQVLFPDNVGRCDHINSCGYHYTPKECFQDNPAIKEMLVEQEKNGNNIPTAVAPTAKPLPNSVPKASHLPSDWVEQSMRRFDINPLYRYLTTVAGKDKTDRLFNLYKVGTSKM